jgi:PST family polysaccharide transporter
VAYGVWTTVAAWLAYGRLPGPPLRGGKAIDFRFSVHLTAYNVVTYLANNIGLVAGFRLGAMQVGFLNRALQFFHLTYTSLLVPVTDVALSLLCRLRGDEEYRRGYVAMAQRAWMLVLPLALVLPLIADDLMLCLLGAAWLPAAPLLAWFAPAIITRGFASLFAQLLTSQGRGTELHRWALADLALRAAGAFAGAPFGPAGIAAGFSLVGFFVTLPCMLWIAGRRGPVGVREQLDAVRPAALVGLAAAGAAGAMLYAATRLGLHVGWTRFLLVGSASAAAAAMATLAIVPARRALLGTGIAEAFRGAR